MAANEPRIENDDDLTLKYRYDVEPFECQFCGRKFYPTVAEILAALIGEHGHDLTFADMIEHMSGSGFKFYCKCGQGKNEPGAYEIEAKITIKVRQQ